MNIPEGNLSRAEGAYRVPKGHIVPQAYRAAGISRPKGSYQ